MTSRPPMPRTIAASIMGVYEVLGFPDKRQPNAISQDKLITEYGPTRHTLGRDLFSRTLTIGLPRKKRDKVANMLYTKWIQPGKRTFDLREVLELTGTLEDATRDFREHRSSFNCLCNQVGNKLQAIYYHYKNLFDRKKITMEVSKKLSLETMYCLQGLLLCQQALFLFNVPWKSKLEPETFLELEALFNSLKNYSVTWQASIGHLIPGDHHIDSLGDSSMIGGSAHCPTLQCW